MAAADEDTRALWALHRARVAARDREARSRSAVAGHGVARSARAAVCGAAAGRRGVSVRGRRSAARGSPPRSIFAALRLAEAGDRVDAWIDPPAYTGRPPILLKVAGQAAPETVSAPEDSQIVLRAASADYDGVATGRSRPASRRRQAAVAGRAPLSASPATASSASRAAARQLATFADQRDPRRQADGRTARSAQAQCERFARAALQDRRRLWRGERGSDLRIRREAGAHRLVEPPRFGLSLPNAPGGVGEARTTGDLSEHPWAGAEVTMRLSATDRRRPRRARASR